MSNFVYPIKPDRASMSNFSYPVKSTHDSSPSPSPSHSPSPFYRDRPFFSALDPSPPRVHPSPSTLSIPANLAIPPSSPANLAIPPSSPANLAIPPSSPADLAKRTPQLKEIFPSSTTSRAKKHWVPKMKRHLSPKSQAYLDWLDGKIPVEGGRRPSKFKSRRRICKHRKHHKHHTSRRSRR